MTFSTAKLDAARERLISWLRARRGEWLSTSDHHLAKAAGLTDADSGMYLLNLLEGEGLVQVDRTSLVRGIRFLGSQAEREVATRTLVDVADQMIAADHEAAINQQEDPMPPPLKALPAKKKQTLACSVTSGGTGERPPHPSARGAASPMSDYLMIRMEHAKLKSFSSANRGKATTIRIEIETSDPGTLSWILQELQEARAPKPAAEADTAPSSQPHAGGRARQLALPAPFARPPSPADE